MHVAGGSLKVTTCIIGGTANVGWANLQFIAGYANSDGTFQNLMANPRHTIITADGQTEPDLVGGDYIIYSRPLGERYLVTGYCRTEIEELSQVKVDQGLEGWSQGKQSKLPVAPGWACGHKVSNATELIVLQVLFAIGTLVLFAGDIYITFEGFRGVLKGKPVLTYTVLSGLERRKMLLVFTVLSAMPGLLYSDVSRIYYFTENGFKIWTLSCIMIANFFSFGLVLFVSFVDMIPLRLSRVMSYSAPFFLYTSIAAITIACCNDSTYQFAYNMFYAASPLVSTGHKVVEKSTRVQTLLRVASNVIASMLLFLPMLTLAVLIYQVRWDRCHERITGAFQGMYNRLIVSHNFQTTAMYWNNYSQSCELTQAGWVADSCDIMSSKATPATAWTSIGTTVISYQNSDGTAQNVMANPKRTLIAMDGLVTPDPSGENNIIYSRPLGERYLVTGYCVPQIEELSVAKTDNNLPGWSQGKGGPSRPHDLHRMGLNNRKAFQTPRDDGMGVRPSSVQLERARRVANDLLPDHDGLVRGRYLHHGGRYAKMANDVVVTVLTLGFRGVLQGKPVLTYTVLAGLERRKVHETASD
ncbi:hypothetical protein DYB32_006121 [Aphanomyces invadans]|uniref:Uncharacterized protein n=1 Tax=Aphanomyces invadans TaxID=157072 RepID=A0A3R6VVE4_9STRA|nr:hypothetical protein DYB32_006121 [Aphanomyces invadans]